MAADLIIGPERKSKTIPKVIKTHPLPRTDSSQVGFLFEDMPRDNSERS